MTGSRLTLWRQGLRLRTDRSGQCEISRNRVVISTRCSYDGNMQRLYSMFPTGQPGIALLLLRVSLGIMLVDSMAEQSSTATALEILVASAAVAVALCFGLLTPVMAALCVGIETVAFIMGGRAIDAAHLCIVFDAVALALLGPGGYSIDGKLFGRRLVVLTPPKADDSDR